MKMFGLFVLVKTLRFILGKALVYRHHRQSLQGKKDHTDHVEAKQDISVSWSELDLNLLGEIVVRLTSPTDQVRFHATCGNWLAVEPVRNTTTTAPALLPWFVGYNYSSPRETGMLELSLYEPSCSPNPVLVHKISLSKLNIPCPTLTWAICTKNWLFFCIRRQRCSIYRRNFVLFSPFTKQVIKLPPSDYPLPFKFRSIFSTDPSSSDCVFLLSDTSSSKITILTCRNGDREWTARQFDRADGFVPYQCRPIYLQGIFYFVSPVGQIASYDILSGEFRFENLAIDNQFVLNYRRFCKHYEVFELNGYLMCINYGPRRHIDSFPGNPFIKRFDWASNAWVPVSSLGDFSLFVGKKFHHVGTAKATHDEIPSNKVYYFAGSGCMVYSLENGALVEHKFFSSDFTNPKTTNCYLANTGDIVGRRSSWLESFLGYGQDYRSTNYYWLKPPVVRSCMLR